MSGEHSERAHALLGASKASQWINCPPSARLQESVPDKRSAFADEGTAAHELAEIILRGDLNLLAEFRKEAPHYNAEMENAIQFYVEFVNERYNEALERSPDALLMLEERLDFSEWVPDGFGTGDAVIIADGVLEILDLKYGKGVPVSAEGNSQMRLYALGAWTSYAYLYDIQEVIMTIVQPRLDSVSSDSMTVNELLWWAEDTVKPAAVAAYAGDGEFKAGEHCRWCKVKGNCRARADENMQLLAQEFKDPALLSLDEIGPILTIAENLSAWAKDVQQYAFDQAAAGQSVPGWKLVEGRSVRTIKDKERAIQILSTQLSADMYLKAPELLGITELEKRLGKKELVVRIGDLIIKPPGKPALVPEVDKRAPLNSIAGDFSGEDFDQN